MDATQVAYEIVQWSASIATIVASTYYAKARVKTAAAVGLLSQIPWWTIMVLGGLWGLLPVNCFMVCIHLRALWRTRNRKWSHVGL